MWIITTMKNIGIGVGKKNYWKDGQVFYWLTISVLYALHIFDKLKKSDKIDDYYFLSRSGKQLHRTNIGQIVNKVCDELGIDSKKAYPHNFRHTNAVTMLKNTGDIYTVSKLLGHQQVGITEIYLQGIKDDDILSMVDEKTILHNL